MIYAPFMEYLPFTLPPVFFAVCLTLVLAAIMRWDAVHYVIPNGFNLAIMMLYLPAVYFLKLDPIPGLEAAGAVLVVGLGVFALGVMGGGDIKLLVALSLWAGFGEKLAAFLLLTVLLGGLLSVVLLFLRVTLAPAWAKYMPKINLPRMLVHGEPAPYGLAIASGFLILLWGGRLFTL